MSSTFSLKEKLHIKYFLHSERFQNTPPQNMLLWHINHFELKAFEKQQMQEGPPELPFSFWKQDLKLAYGRCPPCTRRKETFLSPGMRSWGREKFEQANLVKVNLSSHLSLTTLAQVPLPCHILTIYYSLSNLMYKCLTLAASSGLHFPCEGSNVHIKKNNS